MVPAEAERWGGSMHRWVVVAAVAAIGLTTGPSAVADTTVQSPYAVRGALTAPSAGESTLWAHKDGADTVGQKVVRHGSSGEWTTYELPRGGLPVLLDMSSDTDGYVRTSSGRIEHWDGAVWTPIPDPTSDGLVEVAMSSPGPDDLWVAGDVNGDDTRAVFHWNGTSWRSWTLSGQVLFGTRDVDALSVDDAWALQELDAATFLWHWDGAGWSSSEVPGGMPGYEVVASAGGAWVLTGIGDAQVRHFDGDSWAELPPAPTSLYHLAVGPDGSLWASAATAAYHYVDGAWVSVAYPDKPCAAGRDAQLDEITIGGDGRAYVVGTCMGAIDHYTLALRLDGSTWTRI